MKISNSGIELIKKHESFSGKAYLCPAGVWTIGWGHTGGVKSGDVTTEAQAMELLRADLKHAEDAVKAQGLKLRQSQFDALVSFVFNVGIGNFQKSTLLRVAKENPNDLRIKSEFDRWVYGGGRVLPGLVKRRKDESNLYFKK